MKKGLLGLVAVLVLVMVTGCAEWDRMITLKEDFKAKETGQTQTPPPPADSQAKEAAAKQASAGGGRMVSLFFSDEQGRYLVEEKRVIPKDVDAVRRTVQELAKGPGANSRLVATLPEGTVVRGILVDAEGVCTVDFSQELIANHSGGSTGEALTVYSIVDTLTQFDHIDKVLITVEGKPIETIAGHLDVSEAMARNTRLLSQ